MFVSFIAVLLFLSSCNGVDELASGPRNCKEVLKNGGTTSGTYQIQTSKGPRQVMCDQTTEGGGWTVIQQRYNGKLSFHDKTWKEYKDGFGQVDLLQNFYLGNDLISEISQQAKIDPFLRIELTGDRNPGSKHAKDFYWGEYYFRLADESTDYTPKVYMNWPNTIGNLSTGWYDFTYSNGVKFSTIDRINDPMPECITDYHLSGWWTHYCGLCSLNGEYVPKRWGDGYGLFYTIYGEYIINPVKTKMMLRDRD
ncbi:hypothetical protein M3Y97_01033300 [Aphelenchoides bicaudatus]|nr:hypothetical protein M3Y97_01033300 [Aphelenchoides bicaudatus]